MYILGIETSCDDTCAAVLCDDHIISNVISSQIDLHAEWGGVVPDIAKRAHQERIGPVVATALKRARKTIDQIDLIAVTRGPGLGIALAVGFKYALNLAKNSNKPLVAVNHVEGHLLSVFLKNSKGQPNLTPIFPCLGLTVSGGHTKIVLLEDIGDYHIVGETLDDAAGEALDKSAKLLGLGYPGGPVIERIAKGGDAHFLKLPSPLPEKVNFNLSFSGLKTSFYYQIKDWSIDKKMEHLSDLAATFQTSVFDHLLRKFSFVIDEYQPKSILASGGVMANTELRSRLRKLARTKSLPLYLPQQKKLNTDNAAMIALAGYHQFKRLGSSKLTDLDISSRFEL
ncbi:MAG: tRNA (adenosine(37)-N6)-threonylcarbamoyltransferase complex transferase subunit TsaD [Candidatus Shapirobacteria bacterium]